MQYQFDVNVATRYGVDEAIFIHNIYFWVLQNRANGRNMKDGRAWTYNSMAALADLFPFWTVRQLERIIKSCVDKGLLETATYNERSRDRTKWYTVTPEVDRLYAAAGAPAQDPADLPPQQPEADSTKTVDCIPPNGEMETTKRWNASHQTVKCILGTDSNNTDSKPDRESAPAREAYGEFCNVRLSSAEMDKLTARWPPNQVHQEIDALSTYMRSKGKRYADHYATLLNWLKRDFPPAKPEDRAGALIEEDWCNYG